MSNLVNPYIAGAPVAETSMFFGREDVFQWIENNLTGKFTEHILVVHGQRRVGKTSVLKQLGAHLSKKYIPIFFDLQGRTHTTLDRFLWWLSREMARVIKQDLNLDIALPEREEFSKDPDFFESQFLPSLLPQLGHNTLLLTFDEFDNLEDTTIRETLARPLIDYLLRLLGRKGLSFIFSIGSSGRKLENMRAEYTEFFKTALYKKISFLSKVETRSLIIKPVAGILTYDPAAVEAIFAITSGHPYFTQLICHELFSVCQQTKQKRIRSEDVEAVLGEVVERGTVNLKFVWDEASELEKWILASLAQQKEDLDTRTLTDFLRKQKVRFNDAELQSALLHLREKDILTDSNRFVIHLLRIWLQKNRSMDKTREELTEINPIATHYISIGMEYMEKSDLTSALSSFLEVLRVDPDNIQAMVCMAQVHVKQKAYEKAVVQFEKALAVDEEDISARSGLCETHLLLGDNALAKGRSTDALQSYQRVLFINADHTEARQRVAEIYTKEAETALASKKLEEAEKKFALALRFTPEDQELQNRLREVQLRLIRVKALSLTKSEDWDQALTTWSEYLSLAPEDDDAVHKQIDRIQKLKMLEETYQEAKAALVEKEYDKASGLLKKIIAEDDNYKDAIDLLRQAVLAKKGKRVSKNPVAWWNILLAGLFTIGVLGGTFFIFSRIYGWSFEPQPTPLPTTSPLYTGVVRSLSSNGSQSFPEVGINTYTIDPTNSETIYVGTNGAGIYISRNGGQTWSASNVGLGKGTVGQIAVDPQKSNIVYAALSEQGGVYKSTDGGRTWASANAGIDLSSAWEWLAQIYIDPLDSDRLYYTGHSNGFYRSLDGGNNWEKRSSTCPWITDVAVDPSNFDHLYAGNNPNSGTECQGGVYTSVDGGQTWKSLNSDFLVMPLDDKWADDIWHVATDPHDFKIIYAGGNKATYKTIDGGQTWTKILAETCYHLAASPIDGIVYCIQPNNLRISNDGGLTWTSSDFQGCQSWDCQILSIAPDDPQVLYGGGSIPSQSIDGGNTWLPLGKLGFASMQLTVDPIIGKRLYLNSADISYWSDDGGNTWSQNSISGGPPIFDLYQGDIYMVGEKLYRSIDNGLTWEGLGNGIPTNSTLLAIDPQNRSRLWLLGACGNRPFLSIDKGETFTEVRSFPKVICPSSVLLVSSDGRRVFIGDWGKTYRSDDGGETWLSLNGPGGGIFTAGIIDPTNPDAVYLGSPYLGVLKTTNAGQTWSPMNNGLTASSINDLKIDPLNPNTIFAATSGGVFATFDGGNSWHHIEKNLGTNPIVYSIAIDPNNSTNLYAATPDGVYVIQVSSMSTSAEDINAFAGSILAATATRTPDYADDFSTTRNGWSVGSTPNGDQWGYDGGAYAIKVTPSFRNDNNDPCIDTFFWTQPEDKNYVLDVTVQFVSGTVGNWHLGFRDTTINFFPDGSYSFEGGAMKLSSEEDGGIDPNTEVIRLTIVAQGSKMAFYVGGQPLVLLEDSVFLEKTVNLFFGACSDASTETPFEVKFDDLKIWEISGLP
jgi:photosystem II stability/assembly factor-like uncharacterized protein/tetratricopeptide (TPR) repeat protein